MGRRVGGYADITNTALLLKNVFGCDRNTSPVSSLCQGEAKSRAVDLPETDRPGGTRSAAEGHEHGGATGPTPVHGHWRHDGKHVTTPRARRRALLGTVHRCPGCVPRSGSLVRSTREHRAGHSQTLAQEAEAPYLAPGGVYRAAAVACGAGWALTPPAIMRALSQPIRAVFERVSSLRRTATGVAGAFPSRRARGRAQASGPGETSDGERDRQARRPRARAALSALQRRPRRRPAQGTAAPRGPKPIAGAVPAGRRCPADRRHRRRSSDGSARLRPRRRGRRKAPEPARGGWHMKLSDLPAAGRSEEHT